MKNLIILLIGTLFLILNSCVSGKTTKTTEFRIIRNESSHEVELIITASTNYQIHLVPGDSAIFKGYYAIGEGPDFSQIGWSAFEPISGKIIFNNEKEIVYKDGSCENGRNPLNPNIWQFHSCGYFIEDTDGDGLSEYIYEITDADYEMAVPIED